MTDPFSLDHYGVAVDQSGFVAIPGAAEQCKPAGKGAALAKIMSMIEEALDEPTISLPIDSLPLCEQHRERLKAEEGIHAAITAKGRVIFHQVIDGELRALGVLAASGATH